MDPDFIKQIRFSKKEIIKKSFFLLKTENGKKIKSEMETKIVNVYF